MRIIVAGNWKMHTDAEEAGVLLDALSAWSIAHKSDVQMIVAPPYPFLAMAVKHTFKAEAIIIAAQNCHQEEQGAYTGEVSVPMLKSIGVRACIVGHSERRDYFGETDAVVGKKIRLLLKHGLQPIYCCGERREEREDGRYREVVSGQLHKALGVLSAEEVGKLMSAEDYAAVGRAFVAVIAADADR